MIYNELLENYVAIYLFNTSLNYGLIKTQSSRRWRWLCCDVGLEISNVVKNLSRHFKP